MAHKQTAVEWLINQIAYDNEFKQKRLIQSQNTDISDLYKEAKKMETKQLSKSYYKGVRHEWEGAGGNFEDYYKETYGSDSSIQNLLR